MSCAAPSGAPGSIAPGAPPCRRPRPRSRRHRRSRIGRSGSPMAPGRARSGLGREPSAASSSAATSSGIGDVGRQVVGGAQQGRLVGLVDRDLGDDPAAEDDDRPVAGELDLLELRGVEAGPPRRRRPGRGAARRSAAWCRCRSRGSGRSRASSGRRRRPSGRWSPSAGCRRTAGGPRTRRACRSGAA